MNPIYPVLFIIQELSHDGQIWPSLQILKLAWLDQQQHLFIKLIEFIPYTICVRKLNPVLKTEFIVLFLSRVFVWMDSWADVCPKWDLSAAGSKRIRENRSTATAIE